MIDRHYNNSIASSPTASLKIWVKVAILIAAFVYSCFPAIRALVKTWSVQDVYSYGFLVPVISLLWIWQERIKLRQIPVKPSFIGGTIVLMVGSLMLVLGEVSSAAIVQELAVVVIIPGLVLMLLGTQFYLALFLPLSFLILMVPILNGFIDRLHAPFQLFAAATAVKLLSVAGIPVFRSGNFIELPNITLEVTNACSGVRFLISIMVLSVPLAFITQKSWMQKALLLFLAIVIGVVSNPIRVTLVTLWAYYGDGDIHGPSHILQGYVVYQIGLIILFICAWLLCKFPLSNTKQHAKSERTNTFEGSDLNKFHQAWLVSFIWLLVLGVSPYMFKSEPVQLKARLHELPVIIGEWKDAGIKSNAPYPILPGADVEFARIYRNASGREITLRIAYFESQGPDKKLIYYKLQALNENNEELTILKDSHRAVAVNKTVLHGGPQDSFILSWYALNGRIIANQYMAKLMTAFQGLVYRRTNGALIIVSSPTLAGGTEGTQRDVVSFVQDLLPVLDGFIP
jgi:EpsI family protein